MLLTDVQPYDSEVLHFSISTDRTYTSGDSSGENVVGITRNL